MPSEQGASNRQRRPGRLPKSPPFGTRGVEPVGCRGSRQKGFTVIELMVAVAVVGILARIAFPAVRNMVLDNSMASLNNQLLASLKYAREQAITQHTAVMVCKTATPTVATPTCDTGTGSGYEEGWVVCTYNAASTTPQCLTTPLRAVTVPAQSSGTTIKANHGAAYMVGFTSRGQATNITTTPTPAYMVLCDSRQWSNSGQYARVIQVASSGFINGVAGNDSTAGVTTCSPS